MSAIEKIKKLHHAAWLYNWNILDAFGLAAINTAISTAGEANAPKAKAIQDWSRVIWSDYRARKEAVSAGNFNDNYDFQSTANFLTASMKPWTKPKPQHNRGDVTHDRTPKKDC
jgi:gamma-glutamylcysteine synthetase